MFTLKQCVHDVVNWVFVLSRILKQNKNDTINVGDRLKHSTFSNTLFWPIHTGVCVDFP